MITKALTLAAVAAVMAGCAATGVQSRDDRVARTEETDCLWVRTITDWQALDDRNLLVFAGRSQPYHVELAQSCFGLEFEDVIAFYDRGGDERICGFGMDRVIVNRTVPEACGIVAVDALTEDQAEELTRRYDEEGRAAVRP